MAQAFLRTHGDIPSVLRAMLHAPEFWSPEAYQAKVKTPLEYVVSAARASHAEIVNTQPLVNALNQMGMPLYGCVPPTGWSDKADAWVSTGALVTRMNFGLNMALNHLPGIQTVWVSSEPSSEEPALRSNLASDEQRLEVRLIPTGVSVKTRIAILNQVQDPSPTSLPAAAAGIAAKPAPQPTRVAENANGLEIANQIDALMKPSAAEKQDAMLAGLLIGSPEFQRR